MWHWQVSTRCRIYVIMLMTMCRYDSTVPTVSKLEPVIQFQFVIIVVVVRLWSAIHLISSIELVGYLQYVCSGITPITASRSSRPCRHQSKTDPIIILASSRSSVRLKLSLCCHSMYSSWTPLGEKWRRQNQTLLNAWDCNTAKKRHQDKLMAYKMLL